VSLVREDVVVGWLRGTVGRPVNKQGTLWTRRQVRRDGSHVDALRDHRDGIAGYARMSDHISNFRLSDTRIFSSRVSSLSGLKTQRWCSCVNRYGLSSNISMIIGAHVPNETGAPAVCENEFYCRSTAGTNAMYTNWTTRYVWFLSFHNRNFNSTSVKPI
jgi:hypothetical protein